MSGICDTCKTKIRCIAPVTGVVECDFYEPSDKSRWHELFGTPERAARTYLDYFLNGCDGSTCADGCPFFDTSAYMNCAIGIDDYDKLLEWLRGDAE